MDSNITVTPSDDQLSTSIIDIVEMVNREITSLLRGDSMEDLEEHIEIYNIDDSVVATLARYQYLIDPTLPIATQMLDEEQENLQWVLELAVLDRQWEAISYCLFGLKDLEQPQSSMRSFGIAVNLMTDDEFQNMEEILDDIDRHALNCSASFSYSDDSTSTSDEDSIGYDTKMYSTYIWRRAIMDHNEDRDLDHWFAY